MEQGERNAVRYYCTDHPVFTDINENVRVYIIESDFRKKYPDAGKVWIHFILTVTVYSFRQVMRLILQIRWSMDCFYLKSLRRGMRSDL